MHKPCFNVRIVREQEVCLYECLEMRSSFLIRKRFHTETRIVVRIESGFVEVLSGLILTIGQLNLGLKHR